MKKIFYFSALGFAALIGATFGACTNDDETAADSYIIKPVKTPDFTLYSGSNIIWTSFGTKLATRVSDAGVNSNYYKVQDFIYADINWVKSAYPVLAQYIDNAPASTDRGECVSTDEYNFVIDYIKNHPDEGGKECNLTTYFIQNVGSSYDTYAGDFLNGETVHHTQYITGGNQMDYAVWGEVHINDYNATWGPRALCVDIPVTNPTYHDSWGTEDQTKVDAYKFYYINYEGRTNCYLCYDYRVKKYDNGQLDFKGDGVYNDWVIKLIPADGSEAKAPVSGGEDPETDPEIEPADDDAVTVGEVEINLSVNDKKDEGDYIATKLSIHVRDTTDVEVFIPVPAYYYCDADDMNIVLNHELPMAYGSTNVTYDIDGTVVTAFVQFENEGIRVTTSGITAAVLRYLRANYFDGLTIEVWNYFNDAVTREALKPLLDHSTVTFVTDPENYINAIADLADEGETPTPNPWDCFVVPTSGAYGSPVQGWHNNGSEFNYIYKK